MFRLRRPADQALHAMLTERADAPFTHDAVGATRGDPPNPQPAGYVADRYGVALGRGAQVFDRARDAISRFAMYPSGWTEVYRLPGDIREGLVFATIARHFGFYSVHPCRVVYVIDDDSERARRFGFAIGTLPGHSERGEERFCVSWDRGSDEVRYDVEAFSRPNDALTRIGYPIARLMQKRFARDGRAAMRAATR